MPKKLNVVYGAHGRLGLIVAGNDAASLAAEIAALEACRTLGEIRALAPRLRFKECPILLDEDDWPNLPDDEPIDVTDGENWGLDAQSITQATLPVAVLDEVLDIDGVEFADPMMDGESFLIPVERERELLAVFAAHGISARRDDDLINALGR